MIKKLSGLLGLMLLTLLFAVCAFAADPAPVPGFDWVGPILAFLATIPKVGPILAIIFGIVGGVATLMTAVSVFVQTVLAIPVLVLHWAGATAVAAKIKSFSEMIMPWLKWFSMFNVQK